MAHKYHIQEVDIYKFITDTFNDNSSDNKISFSIGYYFMDISEGDRGAFFKRFTQQGGRFDIKKTFSDDTYELNDTTFVPMSIPMLNANYLAHDVIKEVTYEPTIQFLVYSENINAFNAIMLTIEQVRARLIQYQTTLDVEYIDIDNPTASTRITETLKVIAMAGEINYGDLISIAGKRYLSVTMPLTLEVTNVGEYGNQEKWYLSVPSVGSGAFYEIQPLSWNYGVGISTEANQLLNDVDLTDDSASDVIRHVPINTAYSIAMAVQIDLSNDILYKIFKDSRLPTKQATKEIWTLKSEFYKLNDISGEFEIDNDLTINNEFYLDMKKPIEQLSKGEKIIYSLSFVPRWIVERET